MMNNPFKIIKLNPFPVLLSINMMNMMMNINNNNLLMMMMSMMNMMLIIKKWTKMMMISNKNKSMMKLNNSMMMKMIILTETMFFSSFFYINMSNNLFPNYIMNTMWPMKMFFLNYYISLMNTFMLMNSSITITLMMMKMSNMMMNYTNMLGIYFIMIQFYEFNNISFSIINSSFWSMFFTLTTFHMMHVMMGILSLNMMFKNMKNIMLTMQIKYLIWYWHFIDLIWISIFMLIYYFINTKSMFNFQLKNMNKMMFKMMILMTMMMMMMMMISMIINKNKKKKKMNNNSSYECGFNNINKKRSPLSIQFYMITIIYLIFDMEMIMIMPMMMNMKSMNMNTMKMSIMMMLMTMTMTLIYEWINNSIKWKK